MSSKITIYDFLAIVVQGFLILMVFPLCCNDQITFINNKINEPYLSVFLFITSYVIGLIYHKSVECMSNKLGFRNNEKCIRRNAEKFLENFKRDSKNVNNLQNINQQFNINYYYKAYYELMKENMLNNIPILEAQVAFIRNMLPLTLVYIIVICCSGFDCFDINPCFLVILLLISIVIMFFILIDIQNKIYYLVWEGYEYLKQIKNCT